MRYPLLFLLIPVVTALVGASLAVVLYPADVPPLPEFTRYQVRRDIVVLLILTAALVFFDIGFEIAMYVR